MTVDITPREVGTILEAISNLKQDVAEIKLSLEKLSVERDLQEVRLEDRLRKLEDFRSRAYAIAAIATGAWMAFGYYLVSHAH